MDVLNVIVVDESGSMGVQKGAVIDGINEFLEVQTAETEGNCYVSLMTFGGKVPFNAYCVGTKAGDVVRLDGHSYSPYGSTPLYDGIGAAVKGTEQWLVNNPWFEGKVVVTVYTDGGENASTQWHLVKDPDIEDARDINNLIQYKNGEGWEWLMLGSGGSAWLEAAKFTAIPRANVHTVVAGAASSTGTYQVLNNATSHTRSFAGKASETSYAASFNNDSVLASITVDSQ